MEASSKHRLTYSAFSQKNRKDYYKLYMAIISNFPKVQIF